MSTPGAERPGPSTPPYTVGLGPDELDPEIYGPNAGLVVDVDKGGKVVDARLAAPGTRPGVAARGDDTMYPADAGLEDTPLEDLARDVEAAVLPTTTFPISTRPGWEASYRLDITANQIESWRKRAKKGREVNTTMFSALALAETNTGLLRQGKPVRLDGTPQTFRDTALHESLGVARATEAILKVYGLEGQVDATARALLREAGWGDELEAMSDPT